MGTNWSPTYIDLYEMINLVNFRLLIFVNAILIQISLHVIDYVTSAS
jgi:hypothetical protein